MQIQKGHNNVILLHGIVKCTSGARYIALEFAQNGDLHNLIKREKLLPHQIQSILHELCLGMHYLHSNGVLHRDLKPENVLVNSDFTPKITDFGLSKISTSRRKSTAKKKIKSRKGRNSKRLSRVNTATKLIGNTSPITPNNVELQFIDSLDRNRTMIKGTLMIGK